MCFSPNKIEEKFKFWVAVKISRSYVFGFSRLVVFWKFAFFHSIRWQYIEPNMILYDSAIWVFPKKMVPPNHQFF